MLDKLLHDSFLIWLVVAFVLLGGFYLLQKPKK